MTRYIVLCIVGLCISGASYGKRITFVTADNQPVAAVRCVGYTVRRDSIGSWKSDERGNVNIRNERVHYLTAHHPDFSDRIIYNNDADTIVLTSGIDLDEVVVTPSDMEEFDTHTSYRISQADMQRYPNVLQSLNVIPNLTVLSNGMLFYEGETNIKILINGVDASAQEVKTLSKEDIAKVNVYQTPPARFLAQGVSAVLDIRLKSNIHGGNGAVDIYQALYPLNGNNTAALYYNYRRSRFSLLYNNENKHFRKHRRSEVLDYDFDDVNYHKTKTGLDSKNHYDDNNLNLSYQINIPDNFLYNIKSAISFLRDGGTFNQNVNTGSQSFLATNMLRTSYTKYKIGNYFEKNLGEDVGSILANVNFNHFSTSYRSAYNEFTDDSFTLSHSSSRYKTHFNAVFSEIQYQLPANNLGIFSFSAYENYKFSKYVDTSNPFTQTTNALGAMAQWLGRKGAFRWYLTLGFNWDHISSTSLPQAHNLWIPTPSVNINWRPSRNVRLSFNYSYTGRNPSIAQLSETDQWLDTRLVYHGNSTLSPYKTHTAGIRFVWNNRYLNLSLYNSFQSSPDMICDMYTVTDKYMLQTLVNLTKYRIWASQLDLTIMPLGNNKLEIWNCLIVADLNGKNHEYSWNGYRFQWMSDIALNLTHWTVELFYQYPGKIVEGQFERPRPQCWSATLLYRPTTDLSVGIEWFMPFGKGLKESEHTVNAAPVYADTETYIRDWSNLISFKLSYNFSFGRNRNRAAPQFDNGDSDTGILHK